MSTTFRTDKASDEDEPIVVTAEPESSNDDDVDIQSGSSDNDNAKVREKLKKTSIAKTTATNPASPRRTRKRSHDESEEDKVADEVEQEGNARRRRRAHERKRSRELTDEDRVKVGSSLERVKTPPTHREEDVEGIAGRVSSPRGLERKRGLGTVDTDAAEDSDQKRKLTKTEREKEERGKEEDIEMNKPDSPAKDSPSADEAKQEGKKDEQKEASPKPKTLLSGGFGNTSSKSPFATASAGTPSIFGSGGATNAFTSLGFGAASKSSASPFGTFGAGTGAKTSVFGSGSQSPFGALGAKGPLPAFGAPATKSPPGIGSSESKKSTPKPFGAPDESDDSEEDGSDGDEDGEDNKTPDEPPVIPTSKIDEETVYTSETCSYWRFGFKQEQEVERQRSSTPSEDASKDTKEKNEATRKKEWSLRGHGVVKINRPNDPEKRKTGGVHILVYVDKVKRCDGAVGMGVPIAEPKDGALMFPLRETVLGRDLPVEMMEDDVSSGREGLTADIIAMFKFADTKHGTKNEHARALWKALVDCTTKTE